MESVDESEPISAIQCQDFSAFQAILKSKREIDDKIVYLLNTSIPTNSFTGEVDAKEQCRGLYDQIRMSYEERNIAIKSCVDKTRSAVNHLQIEKNKVPSDVEVHKRLRAEQTKLRLIQQELNVEEVLKDRILKVFNDRCKFHYKSVLPP